MLGVMPPADALSIAKEKNLSLVEVQAHAVPPVWKLKEAPANAARAAAAAALGGGTSTAAPPDGKKERSSKPKKPPKEKEVRLTDSIAPRDAEHKIQSALKFLEKGQRDADGFGAARDEDRGGGVGGVQSEISDGREGRQAPING